MLSVDEANELAQVVLKHGIEDLIRAVGFGKIELPEAARIAQLPNGKQHALAVTGFIAPVERDLVAEIEALWHGASKAEQSEALGSIADILGLDVPKRQQGALFADDRPVAARTKTSDAEFEVFWKAFPRKTDKVKSRAAFEKSVAGLCKDMAIEEAIRKIMDGVAAYAKSIKDDVVCHATTWLNRARWEDEIGATGSVTDKKRFGEFRKKTPQELAVF